MLNVRIPFLLFIITLVLSCGASEDKIKQTPSVESTENQDPVDEKDQKVKISTQFGDIIVLLYNDTPIHRDNFLKLANEGFYDDLLFHRVMRNFMVQGGDPKSKDAEPGAPLGATGPGYTIEAEFRPNHFHKRGALAAARQPDQVNPEKRSSGSQFYIVHGTVYNDNTLNSMEMQKSAQMKEGDFRFSPEQKEVYKTIGGAAHLDGDYTVFGEVIEGMNVVDSIAVVQVDRRSRPMEDVKMTIEVIEE